MRLLVLDPPGHGLDIAMRAQAAGHTVKHAIKQTEKTRDIGRGFVEVIADHKPWMRWSDLVLCTDNSLYLQDLERHRNEGGLCIGPTPEHAKWELDREFGQKMLQKHGIESLPGTTFTDYDKAIAFVKKTMKRYVSKPSGMEPNKALSYCSSGPDDMIYMLERWKRLQKLKTPFILQEFVPGIEMAVAGWFGPGGWNEGWEENFEFKKLMNEDKGPNTGEMGTINRYVKTSKLARKVLEPLTETLEKINYVGDIDVNCIIDEKGNPWPLEFTTRLGWPAFQLQTALVQGDPIEWLYDLAMGRDAKAMTLNKVCCGVVMAIPDYPYSHATRKEVVGMPIYGIEEWDHVHPCEMMMGEKVPVTEGDSVHFLPMPVTAGDYLLVMTGIGETVKEASSLAYRRLEKLTVCGSPLYRTDIGKRLRKHLPLLQSHGYATGMKYL